ncbi:MAG: hypothetical protein KAT46_03060 [Deltaproteobacteria bacterium]|nr:hypothetical protein [Deltaproteobacteria bacterium]
MSYVSEESLELLRLIFLINDSSQLLFSGGWAEQPLWFIEAYEIFKVELARDMQKKSSLKADI